MTTNELKQDDITSLQDYFLELTTGEIVPRPENETWEAAMKRMESASWPAESDEETYFYFLGVLPPRFMYGSYFCFAEGMEPFQLFWERNERYFVRTLDWHQTRNFCRLADIPVYE
jgi:hypothetical protein